ncbi:MAG: D-alanyl-D-alanine carboxypeptidase [Limnochordia bacterium]|nr:D-alanyl-D-alanine carboxypeptidase [Limnochordia bacterium]
MRASRTVGIAILAILVSVALFQGQARALEPPPELSSIAYAVYDGEYGYLALEKNAYQRRSIASITKVMTLLVAVELVEEGKLALDALVTASAKAQSREGTQINLKAGDQLTVEELLYAAALVSANDAAVALAEYVAGSEEDFTRLMNAKAEELGLEDTNYVDCTGLLSIFSNNYSTAFDQVRLLQVALDHELFRTILATPDYYIESRDRKIKNSHPLLDRGGVEGGKTGATTPAGHTLITACTRQEKRLIIVVLGARSREVRNRENEALVEWAFGNLRTVISSEEVITPVLIPDGVDHQVNAVLAREFQVVALEEANLEYETEPVILPDLRAPIDRGDKVGELVVSQGGEEFVRLDLVAAQSTGLATWLRRLFNGVNRVFRGGGG